jgi:hypothetical protein
MTKAMLSARSKLHRSLRPPLIPFCKNQSLKNRYFTSAAAANTRTTMTMSQANPVGLRGASAHGTLQSEGGRPMSFNKKEIPPDPKTPAKPQKVKRKEPMTDQKC